ncbi:MAG: HpcH/HpaI aldolase family protein [Chthoniobacterales bacterium]
MRKSRILREVADGKFATCLKINIPHPDVIELAGLAGASSVWLCNEHIPTDWSAFSHCVRAAKVHDMDVIIRVSKGSYNDYIKPFEADATGIMVPHVTSAREAEKIVEICRFPPLGNRALDGGNVDGKYCQTPLKEYMAESNRERLIILQIESPEAVEVIDEIAAVPGYNMLLFGPGDFSARIGDAGNINHPDLLKARRRVEEAAQKYGKQLFAVPSKGGEKEMLEKGYVIGSVGSDVYSLGAAFREAVATYSSDDKTDASDSQYK